jgi:hypothetical protein
MGRGVMVMMIRGMRHHLGVDQPVEQNEAEAQA